MSTKAIVWGVVGVVVLGGIWYFWNMSQSNSNALYAPTSQGQTQTAPSSGTSAASSNTSDAQLNADLSAMDSQLQGASADSSSAASFNDTPIQQAQ